MLERRVLELGLDDARRVRRPLPLDRRALGSARGDRRLRDAVPQPGADRLGRAHLRDRGRLRASSRRPYWYAQDMLASGAGTLVPFDDPAALADAVCDYVEQPETLAAARAEARRIGSSLAWPSVAEATAAVLREAHELAPRRRPAGVADLHLHEPAHRPPAHARRRRRDRPARARDHPEPRQRLLRRRRRPPRRRLARARAPRRRAGLDARSSTARSPSCTRPTGDGGMRNFMSYDRRWLDEPHVGDHVGRSVWALGEILATAWIPAVVVPARDLLDAARRRARGRRLAAHGRLRRARPRRASTRDRLDPTPEHLLERLVEQLADAYERTAAEDWSWFEDELSYDNARLSQALISGGDALDRDDLVELGLESLRWLGDECGLDGRRPAPAGPPRPAAGRGRPRAPATSSRSTPPRSSRPSSPPSRSRASRARRAGDARVRVVPRPQPPAAAALRLRDRRLQRRPRRRGAERERGRRVDARVPPRRAAPRRRRRPRRVAEPRTGAGGGVSRAASSSCATPGNPILTRRGLAVSRQRRLQPGGRRASTARPSCSPGSRTCAGSRTSPSPAPRTASTAGRSIAEPLLAPDDERRERAVGLRGRARRLGRRARPLGHHLHRLRAGRPGGVPRDDRGLHDGRAPRDRQASRGQERGAAAAPARRPLGALPPPARPSSAAAAARSCSPAPTTSSAGARPSRCSSRATAPGGTRSASASGRRRSGPSTAGCSSTTASRRRSAASIYRVGLALLDLDEPTRVLRRLPDWILAPLAPYERDRRRPERRLPLRARPRRRERRDPPLLRRGGQLDLPRDRAARRPARRRARRAGRRLNDFRPAT